MEQRGNSAGWRKQIGVIFSRRVAQLVEHHERLLDISARRSQVRVLPRRQFKFYIPKYFISKSDFSMLPRREVRQLFDFHYQI